MGSPCLGIVSDHIVWCFKQLVYSSHAELSRLVQRCCFSELRLLLNSIASFAYNLASIGRQRLDSSPATPSVLDRLASMGHLTGVSGFPPRRQYCARQSLWRTRYASPLLICSRKCYPNPKLMGRVLAFRLEGGHDCGVHHPWNSRQRGREQTASLHRRRELANRFV